MSYGYDSYGEDHPDRDLGNNPFAIDFSDDAYYGRGPQIPTSTVLMDAEDWDRNHPRS